MPINPRQLESILQNKFGFVPAKHRSKDHRYYVLVIPGLPPIQTKVSHSKKLIRARLEAKIARQMRVHKPFYDEMVSCVIGRDAYYLKVVADPHPPFNVRL